MRFGERIVVFLFRPFYRAFVERLLWWFLTKVKIFFIADLAAQVDNIDRRLRDRHDEEWTAIDQRLRASEEKNAAEWKAVEQLLLALFQASELPAFSSDSDASAFQNNAVPLPDEVIRVNGPDYIR